MNSFPTIDVSSAAWRKSSYSQNGNDTCVELAPVSGMVAIRDSKNPGAAVLGFSRSEIRALTKGIREA